MTALRPLAFSTIAVILSGPAFADSLSTPAPSSESYVDRSEIPALIQQSAPVTSVNTKTGNVTVPSMQRQSSTPLDATSGTVTWKFPVAFTTTPTCYESLVSSNPSFTFDKPVVTAISTTTVTESVSAHPSSLSIAAFTIPVSLPLKVNPPAGTMITLTCTAPLP